MLESFDKLSQDEIDELKAFVARDDLLVKGTDATKGAPYRGGCLPYFLLAGAGIVGWAGPAFWDLDRPLAYGLATAMAVIATNLSIRAFRAVRKARALLDEDPAWHALAWSDEQLCFRSFDRCMLARWTDVERIAYLDGEEVNPILRGTLWIHLSDKEKVLVEPRDADAGTFAGRPLHVWEKDLKRQWDVSRGAGG